MAFLRFTRDKRGYEHFYLVEQTTNRRGKVRPRLLYWFRTPPNIKIGREPFDDGVRRLLEAQNPGVEFDWPAIIETPIPSADAERWRERRRAEKAARSSRSADDRSEPPDGDPDEPRSSADALISPLPSPMQARDDLVISSDDAADAVPAVAPDRGDEVDSGRRDTVDPAVGEPVHPLRSIATSSDPARRKRRRRRRGHAQQQSGQPLADASPAPPAQAEDMSGGADGDDGPEDGDSF